MLHFLAVRNFCMSPFFYVVNIGTLATWLAVAGFGTVGMVIPDIWAGGPPQTSLAYPAVAR